MDRATAVRFLLARKFDVARALALHRQHGETRAREGLRGLDARSEPLRSELATGKFTILVRFFIILLFPYTNDIKTIYKLVIRCLKLV